MPTFGRFPTDPPPTEEQFLEGLRAIADDLTDRQWELLTAYRAAPDRRGFAKDVAVALGWKHHATVNGEVVRIAKRFCEAAAFEPPTRRGGDGTAEWWAVLFEGYRYPKRPGRFEWRMHAGLAHAIDVLHRPAPGGDRCPPLAEEVPAATAGPEGAVRRVTVNMYERDPALRRACLAARGTRCVACGLDFGEAYGPIGEGFIHVHHRTPVASGPRETVAAGDLDPVCPNCHAMLHAGRSWDDPRTAAELRALRVAAAAARGGTP